MQIHFMSSSGKFNVTKTCQIASSPKMFGAIYPSGRSFSKQWRASNNKTPSWEKSSKSDLLMLMSETRETLPLSKLNFQLFFPTHKKRNLRKNQSRKVGKSKATQCFPRARIIICTVLIAFQKFLKKEEEHFSGLCFS